MEFEENPNQTKPLISIVNDTDVILVCKVELYDAWSICDFVVSNEHRLRDFFPGTREQNLTPDLSKRFVSVKTKQFENKEELLFTLKLKSSNKVIGLVYIKELDWEKKQGEFAYAIDYSLEGKGITTKLIKQLSIYAFNELKLETLQIIAHKTNVASVKVAEKNGFQWVKRLPKVFKPKGREPMDMELYELYKE